MSQKAAALTYDDKSFLSLEEDSLSLNVSVPLPALPYLPQISLRGHSYETEGLGRRNWYEASSRTLKAELPFGLTFEAGQRFDSFNPSGDFFAGLTFRYSSLRKHNQLLAAYKGSPKRGTASNYTISEQTRGEDKQSSSAWRIGGTLALLAIISRGSGGAEVYKKV